MKSNSMRCHAKSKRSGQQCRSWAVKGKRVCRMHGAFAGLKTKEGRQHQIKVVTKHGNYSREALEEKRAIRAFVRESKSFLSKL